jgi:hypothetical protein
LTNELGGLKLEAKGDVLLIRNKLYIFSPRDLAGWRKYSEGKGPAPDKFACHAFRGKPIEMLNAWYKGERKYRYSRPNTLRESMKRGLTLNRFCQHESTINFGGKYSANQPELPGMED